MTISVGVCTHNGAKYIEEQLNSIISQTVKPDEIILSEKDKQWKSFKESKIRYE